MYGEFFDIPTLMLLFFFLSSIPLIPQVFLVPSQNYLFVQLWDALSAGSSTCAIARLTTSGYSAITRCPASGKCRCLPRGKQAANSSPILWVNIGSFPPLITKTGRVELIGSEPTVVSSRVDVVLRSSVGRHWTDRVRLNHKLRLLCLAGRKNHTAIAS